MRNCRCGGSRILVRPAWFNTLKKPTWLCVAKACPFRKPRLPCLKAALRTVLDLASGNLAPDEPEFQHMRTRQQVALDRVEILWSHL